MLLMSMLMLIFISMLIMIILKFMLIFDNDRFTSFKQYINHLLSKACAAAKKEVFLIHFDVNSFMVLVSYWMNAKLSLIG